MRRYRVRAGLVLQYDVDAEAAIDVHHQIAAVRAAGVDGLDLGGLGTLWAGPDLISITVLPDEPDAEPVEVPA